MNKRKNGSEHQIGIKHYCLECECSLRLCWQWQCNPFPFNVRRHRQGCQSVPFYCVPSSLCTYSFSTFLSDITFFLTQFSQIPFPTSYLFTFLVMHCLPSLSLSWLWCQCISISALFRYSYLNFPSLSTPLSLSSLTHLSFTLYLSNLLLSSYVPVILPGATLAEHCQKLGPSFWGMQYTHGESELV